MRWSTVALGAVAEVQLGKMLSPKARLGGAPDPYLRNINVQWGRLDLSDLSRMDFSSEDRVKFALRCGDLLVCEGGEPGRCAVLETDLPGVFFQKALMRVRPNPERLDTRFLQRFMHYAGSRGVFVKDGNQATIAHFPAVRLNALEIPLPPLEEQHRIAAILDRADAIRHKRQEAIALTEQLLRSTFLEMFGDPATAPKRWPWVAMDEIISDTQYGTSEKANEERQGLPVLRMNNLTYLGGIDLASIKWCEIAPDDLSAYTVKRGDLLFNRTNSPELVGKTAIWTLDEPYAFAGYLVRVRFDATRALPHYVSGFLNSDYGKRTLFAMQKTSNNMSNISATDLRRVRIPLPTIDQQRRYDRFVEAILRSAPRRQDAFAESETLFNSLVQRAFTGQL